MPATFANAFMPGAPTRDFGSREMHEREMAGREHARDGRQRMHLLGLPLDAVTENEALSILEQRLARRQGTWVITPNLDILRQYCTNPSVRPFFEAAESADLFLADGMPLIWASRLARTPLPERVPGSGLVLSLAQRAAQRGWSIFLLGGAPGAADRAAAVLQEKFPGIRIAGTCCPEVGFDKDPQKLAALRQQLVNARPDIVYMALGFPKQEFVTQYLRVALPETTFLGIGISLSFIAGEVKRAPAWIQRVGLEWVHRLVQEPRRLAKRYLVHDAPFALFKLFPAALAARFRRQGMPVEVGPEPSPARESVASRAGRGLERPTPPVEEKQPVSPSATVAESGRRNPAEKGAKKWGERGHPRRERHQV